jgi:hypothetical protein
VEPEEMREEDEQPAVMNVDNPPDVDVASQSSLVREGREVRREGTTRLT